jgi:hypothetical protein
MGVLRGCKNNKLIKTTVPCASVSSFSFVSSESFFSSVTGASPDSVSLASVFTSPLVAGTSPFTPLTFSQSPFI